MKKYYAELFFYKDKINNNGYQEKSNLDSYSKETIMVTLSSNNWDVSKKEILKKYKELAYIHLIESRCLGI